MTRRETIDVLKGLIKSLELETIAPPLQQAFNALKELENMFSDYKKEKSNRVEALKIVVAILENMSDERFEARGNKCQLN